MFGIMLLAIVRKQVRIENSGCNEIRLRNSLSTGATSTAQLTIVAQETFGFLVQALGSNQAADNEVSDGNQQNDEEPNLCLCDRRQRHE